MLRQEGMICRECGKGFQSWKALYGHMRCHSKRVSTSLDVDSSIDKMKKEAAALPPGRSGRMKYYKTDTTSSSSDLESDQEQTEAALCLMMLSRDVRQWDGINSIEAESSDNDPVLGKLNPGKGDESFGFACDGDYENLKSLKMMKPRIKKLEISDSGFHKVESKVSVDRILSEDRQKKEKLEDGNLGKYFLCNKKGNRKKSKLDYCEEELGKDSIKEARMDRADSGFEKYNGSRKERSSNAYHIELGEDSENYEDNQKRSRFECTTCNKTFHSHQALGGHRSSHYKIKACFDSRIESDEDMIETDVSTDPTTDSKLKKSCSNEILTEEEQDGDIDGVAGTSYGSKKNKGHECSVCFKVFASGKALGGHKSSHFAGGSKYRDNQTIAIHEQLPKIKDLFNLNLPPPMEEETIGDLDSNLNSGGSEIT